MRRLVALFLVSILSLSVSAAGVSGENLSLSPEELEGSGIENVFYENEINTDREYYLEIFDDPTPRTGVIVFIEEDSNVTSIEWITQVCINTGVCFAPEINEMAVHDDGSFYFGVSVDETASYINWKFVLHHENGSESTVPETGFGWKVWSNCWLDNGTWGGSSTHCQEEAQEGRASLLPGFAAPAAAAAIGMAALMARRD